MAALVFSVAGCTAPHPGPTTTGTPAPGGGSASSGATPPAEAQDERPALVLSLDNLTAIAPTGKPEDSVPVTDGSAVVAFLSQRLGHEPEVSTIAQKAITTSTWDGVTVTTRGTSSTIRITASRLGDYDVRVAEGITVGMTRGEAIALGAVAGPGSQLDELRLDVREVAGTDSLAQPGTTGVDYVALSLSGDTVSALTAPAGDWRDL